MKKVSMLMIACALIMLFQDNIKAQTETTAVPFLLLAPDSRSGGLGESGSGLADNSAAIFWNPAGIAFLSGSEFSFTHSNWLPQFHLDLFYDYATYRQYIDDLNGSVTASITYMNFGEFVRTASNSPDPIGTFRSFDAALTLGYAAKISQNWGFGFNFRLIHSRLSDKPTEYEQGSGVATSVSFDVAAMWRPEHLDVPLLGDVGNDFSLGINLSNIGPKITYIDQAQADPIPTNLRVGLAARIFQDDYNSLTYTLDFSRLLIGKAKDSVLTSTGTYASVRPPFYESIFTSWTDRPFSEVLQSVVTSMGVEYWYGIPQDFMFALRAGFFYEDPNHGNRKFVTLGAGIRYDLYGFDFSYITTDIFKGTENHPLSNTLRFTLLIGWGSKTQTEKGFPRGI
ncbi:MAG: type IX secretion system outer membrane channel protein PorV [Bacteroidetes bacterium]|nr:type IX secretion system outer membrane channel protein PorV [Bacteroidota bacterium]